MLKGSLLLSFVLALSPLVLAQQSLQTEHGVASAATAACYATFSSGKGANATQYCVTINGNISQFSVAGSQLINANSNGGEGYGFCVPEASEYGYDYAYRDSGNWSSPTFSQSGNVIKITRSTKDNHWVLKQTITNVPASGTGPGSVKVQMALTNYAGDNYFAQILRYANVNAGGASTNDFDYTAETAYGLETNNGRGMSITNNTFSVPSTGFAQFPFTLNVPSGPDPCSPYTNEASQPFVGSGSILQLWAFTSYSGRTVTVTMTYKPI